MSACGVLFALGNIYHIIDSSVKQKEEGRENYLLDGNGRETDRRIFFFA